MSEPIVPFDLHRMFIGEMPPLFMAEVVVRTLIIYFYALAIVRLMSKRGMSELTPLEYLLIIAMGSSAGDPMLYPDVPLLHAMIVLGILIFVRRGIIWSSQRIEQLEHIAEAPPVMVIDDGEVLRDVLDDEELEMASLLEELRREGIRYLSEVEFAYLEPSGRVSVFRYEEPPSDLDPVLPHESGYVARQET
ncbi:MAG: DUF421 domain-containing protein [Armatimonadota bacterium]